jgi:hypothetical protein
MHRNQGKISDAGIIVAFFIVFSTVVITEGFISNAKWYLPLLIAIPALIISLFFTTRSGGNKPTP